MKHYRPHIFVVVALAIVLSSGWHGALRNALTDLRFAWEQRQASGEIVVVAIDAISIEKIGIWPWPRRLYADLLRRLCGVAVLSGSPVRTAAVQRRSISIVRSDHSAIIPGRRS